MKNCKVQRTTQNSSFMVLSFNIML